MSFYNSDQDGKIIIKDDIYRKIYFKASLMEKLIRESNIFLLRPTEKNQSNIHLIKVDEEHLSDKKIPQFVTALFQEFRPIRDRVIYRLNKRFLLELADELISSSAGNTQLSSLVEERRNELKKLFEHLENLVKSKSFALLLIADQDFRSWFTNSSEFIAENEPLLFDPVPWSVRFDGNEFLLTRTQAVAAEQFTTTVHAQAEP